MILRGLRSSLVTAQKETIVDRRTTKLTCRAACKCVVSGKTSMAARSGAAPGSPAHSPVSGGDQPLFPIAEHDPLTTSLLHRGQRVGIAGQEPAAVALFAVYRDTMTGELHRFSAGARDHG